MKTIKTPETVDTVLDRFNNRPSPRAVKPAKKPRQHNIKTPISMFKTIDELKSFLIWAKKERIDAIKIGEIEIGFNNLAFIEELAELPSKPSPPQATEEKDTSATMVDELTDDDEELLNWSSQ